MDKQLIAIDDNGKITAKELYEFLELDKSNYSRWTKANIDENEFYEEGKDWKGFFTMTNGNSSMDYELTIDFSKHLCMLSRSAKGKIARDYFIEAEKQLLKPKPLTMIEVLEIALESEKKALALQQQAAIDKPKIEYFDALVDRNLLTNIRDTAKELQVKQNIFVDFLIEKKYIYRSTKKHIKPFADYVPSLFELKEFTKGAFASTQVLVTPKGRETFRILLDKGVLR